jgi:hypothetical protein
VGVSKPLPLYIQGALGRNRQGIVIQRLRSEWNGPCSPDTHRCKSARNPKVATNECCKKWNIQILKDVAAGLDTAGIPWFIDYGTLLGYMVNKGLYWNDKDTDVCVLERDKQRVLDLMPFWEGLGYRALYKEPSGERFRHGNIVKVLLSNSNKTNCDITFWNVTEDGFLDRDCWSKTDRYKGREMPIGWVFPTRSGEWDGVAVQVPREAEKLIAYRYGKNWRELPAVRHATTERQGLRDSGLMAEVINDWSSMPAPLEQIIGG